MNHDNKNGYIYKFTFTINENIYEYIGSTITLKIRINSHIDQPRKQLQYMFIHFGSAQLNIIQRYENITREKLYEHEYEYIKKYRPYLNCSYSVCYVPCYICKAKILYKDIQTHLSNKHNILPKIKLIKPNFNLDIDDVMTIIPNDMIDIIPNDMNIIPNKLDGMQPTKFIFEQYYQLPKPKKLQINLLYDAIDDINSMQAIDIAKAIAFCEANNTAKLQLGKFIFKSLLKRNLPHEQYKNLYNCYFAKPDQREKFWNIFAEYINNIKTQLTTDFDDNFFSELIVSKSLQFNCIKQICIILGFNNSQDTSTRITDEYLKKFTTQIYALSDEIYTAFQLRDQTGQNSDNHDTSKIMNIINPALKKWGFSKLVKKRIRERIPGGKFIDKPPMYCLEHDHGSAPHATELLTSFKEPQNITIDLKLEAFY